MMDKGEERHDEVLEQLVTRLGEKPGIISVKQLYYGPRGALRGEMDVHYIRKAHSTGKWHHRYYEVKARYSDGAEERAIQQFKRHKQYHDNIEYKYILVTPEVVKRIKL